MAINDGGKIAVHKDVGMVADVFTDRILKEARGSIGIGHVRYATTGAGGPVNAQPLSVNMRNCHIALAHNGNLVNHEALREMLEDSGVVFQTSIDTEAMVNIFARGLRHGLVESIQRMVEIIKGAYALVITTGISSSACGIPLACGRWSSARKGRIIFWRARAVPWMRWGRC